MEKQKVYIVYANHWEDGDTACEDFTDSVWSHLDDAKTSQGVLNKDLSFFYSHQKQRLLCRDANKRKVVLIYGRED